MKMSIYSLACVLLSLSAAQALEVVLTKSGKVSGTTTADGSITSYKGIPFGAPPVGDLRWKAPQPVTAWEGVRECQELGPSPMQPTPVPFSMWSREFLIPEQPISEDCLYLNVWTGARSPNEKRPVLVWIYGGGFNSGGSGCPIYDGEGLARKGIVFVSINYRVGPFGFFAHPELTREANYHASGNYGLLDQIAALKWVHEDIAGFGGDRNNVTIAGQSAGSMSVNCLVASPLAKGLFQRAIAESGASFSRNPMLLEAAEKVGTEAAGRLNASTLSELRAKSSEEILGMQWHGGPIIDGYVLPESIADIFAAGRQNRVDLLTGWNQEEGLMFGPVRKAQEYMEQVKRQYGEHAEQYLSYYPASDDAEAARSQLNASRDTIFGTQNYAWANAQAAEGGNRVYVYRFTRKVPGTGEYAKYGAFHTGEVPYAYDNLKFVDRPWEPIDHELAGTMSTYWSNFIRKGDPNGEALPRWPAYDLDERSVMFLGKDVNASPLPDRAALDFLLAR